MAATRKRAPEVLNQDVDQLKSIFGSTMSSKVQKAPVSEEIHETGFSPEFDSSAPVSVTITEEKAKDPESKIITEEKKEVSDTTVGIRMSTAKKREMKAYFIQHGTTMSQGVLDAFSLLRKLEDKGVVAYKDGLLEISNG